MRKRKAFALLMVLAMMLSVLSGCVMSNAEIVVNTNKGAGFAVTQTLISENYISKELKVAPEVALGTTPDQLIVESYNGVKYYGKKNDETLTGFSGPVDITEAGVPNLVSSSINEDPTGRYMTLIFEFGSLTEPGDVQNADEYLIESYTAEAVYNYKLSFPAGLRGLSDSLDLAKWNEETQTLTVTLGPSANTVKVAGYLERNFSAKVSKVSVVLSAEPKPGMKVSDIQLKEAAVLDQDGKAIAAENLGVELSWYEFSDVNADYAHAADLVPMVMDAVFQEGKLYVANVNIRGAAGTSVDFSLINTEKVSYNGTLIGFLGGINLIKESSRMLLQKAYILTAPKATKVVTEVQAFVAPFIAGKTPEQMDYPQATFVVDGVEEPQTMYNGKKYDMGLMSFVHWTDASGKAVTGAFQAGETYNVEVEMEALSSYNWNLKTAKINGQKAIFRFSEDGQIVYLATTLTCPAAASAPLPFTDVPKDSYYEAAVDWAFNHEPQITDGTSATTFGPDKTCTRGQVVTFLWRAAGCPEPENKNNPFTDVKATDYFYKPVLWAVENKITDGTAPDKFSPANPCTYGHILTFIHRAMGCPATINPNEGFDGPQSVRDDVGMHIMGAENAAEQFPEWTRDAYVWAEVNNILSQTYPNPNSYSYSEFPIKEPCPRKNVVYYLYKISGKAGK